MNFLFSFCIGLLALGWYFRNKIKIAWQIIIHLCISRLRSRLMTIELLPGDKYQKISLNWFGYHQETWIVPLLPRGYHISQINVTGVDLNLSPGYALALSPHDIGVSKINIELYHYGTDETELIELTENQTLFMMLAAKNKPTTE